MSNFLEDSNDVPGHDSLRFTGLLAVQPLDHADQQTGCIAHRIDYVLQQYRRPFSNCKRANLHFLEIESVLLCFVVLEDLFGHERQQIDCAFEVGATIPL